MDDDASWTSRLLRPPSVAFTLPLISDTYLYVEIYVWLYPKSAVLAKKSSILEFPALAKSITHYLNKGATKSKLLLGLPWYGREWETVASTAPSATTGGFTSSRTYAYVKNNAATYSLANKNFENNKIICI